MSMREETQKIARLWLIESLRSESVRDLCFRGVLPFLYLRVRLKGPVCDGDIRQIIDAELEAIAKLIEQRGAERSAAR